jgi:murein DD-endopeptidase MepM/ murein hydrolase activator NlpD
MMRILLGLVLVLALAAAALFVVAGRFDAPVVHINQPVKMVGVDSTLDVTVDAPKGGLTQLDITLEQGGKSTPLFSLASPASASVAQETPERLRITRPIGKRAFADLQAGAGRIVVHAARKGLYGLRTKEASASRDFQARFTPPRIGVASMHHFVNLGGAEMVVYRVTPPDVESGVMVGENFYPGYPASGAGGPASDPSLKVAFFALLYDQDATTPIGLFAKDEAGNQARASFDYKVFPKAFSRGRIELPDAFLQRVVPEILDHTPELKLAVAQPADYLPAFLKINNDLRRMNAQKIVDIARPSSAEMLWKGPFVPLGNAAIESKFADHRTYFYQGKEVDQQVHLGFDLAVTVNIPVKAGNDGKVVYADYLGIYGNCIIIDHGMGVSSLYGHLASIDVKSGDTVKRDQVIGRSGMTGLAGGDHLHFSIQVQGHPVNPVEWWDPHWIDDRILRKIREAGGQPTAAAALPEGERATAAPGVGKPAKASKPRRGKKH